MRTIQFLFLKILAVASWRNYITWGCFPSSLSWSPFCSKVLLFSRSLSCSIFCVIGGPSEGMEQERGNAPGRYFHSPARTPDATPEMQPLSSLSWPSLVYKSGSRFSLKILASSCLGVITLLGAVFLLRYLGPPSVQKPCYSLFSRSPFRLNFLWVRQKGAAGTPPVLAVETTALHQKWPLFPSLSWSSFCSQGLAVQPFSVWAALAMPALPRRKAASNLANWV